MISKEDFTIQMNNLVTYRQKQDERLEHLNAAFPDAMSMLDDVSERLFDQYVYFLSAEMDDSNDFIGYYIFDNDMGKSKLKVTVGSKDFILDNIDALWKVITFGKE